MLFTSLVFFLFFSCFFVLYWGLKKRELQNILILCGSYFFYGYIHPYFCLLIAASTLLDYLCALGIERFPQRAKAFLLASLAFNLSLLGFFKYFNFFIENVFSLGKSLGWQFEPFLLQIVLPVGISFYTFQTLSYTIDVYRGDLKARRSFIDFAVFVAFFPQLVAGPIERASHFIPQVEKERSWSWKYLYSACPLLLMGLFKKLVIADNISPFVDMVFLLEKPPLTLLFVGSIGFAIQIFADFSAYTDIARAVARLLGFELMENFRAPYLAFSPSDFWKRWHISFSSWIRDYVYIPLGGSRVKSTWRYVFIVFVTMGLSGLWHGAAWHFVLWGIFHAFLLIAYSLLGFGGRWKPKGFSAQLCAWMIAQFFIVSSWTLFRARDMSWVWNALASPLSGMDIDALLSSFIILLIFFAYVVPWTITVLAERYLPPQHLILHSCRWLQVALLIVLAKQDPQEFVYFQF
jgi:alginate O-acetyltransferase complex protein AlgI